MANDWRVIRVKGKNLGQPLWKVQSESVADRLDVQGKPCEREGGMTITLLSRWGIGVLPLTRHGGSPLMAQDVRRASARRVLFGGLHDTLDAAETVGDGPDVEIMTG